MDGKEMLTALKRETRQHDIRFLNLDNPDQGIVHVTSPDLGFVLPSTTVACGDSHTCTVGALGALGLAVGTSEITQILATQTVLRSKPKSMQIYLYGILPQNAYAKDVILHLMGIIGSSGARGFAIEFSGPLVSDFTVEERFTICNMAFELGATIALIAPDEKVTEYLQDRDYSPTGSEWSSALIDWSLLISDENVLFDRIVSVDVIDLEPQVTWGTKPDQVVGVSMEVPSLSIDMSGAQERVAQAVFDYMAIFTAQKLEGLPVDRVFIGSCTNARISDLRIASAVIAGKKIVLGIQGIVVPDSSRVQRQAEAEGIDRIFLNAGFEWRQYGCSMCAALNSDRLNPSERCVSTSNRNYEGRQGPGSRTHLVSPATAAASALLGKIADVRKVSYQ